MSIPIVSYYAFSRLVGEALGGELEQLVAARGFTELVLFSDAEGTQLALLPVGTGHRHAKLSDAQGQEIEGLRPICAIQAPENGTAPNPKLEHEQDLARLENSLRARENYLAECEHRIADVGQNLSVREALLEQREHILVGLERDFYERSGLGPVTVEPPPEKETG